VAAPCPRTRRTLPGGLGPTDLGWLWGVRGGLLRTPYAVLGGGVVDAPKHDRTRHPDPVDVATAAALLGITSDAVRARIRRGSLTAEKRAGRWFVFLPERDTKRDTARHDATERDTPTGELGRLRSEVEYLRRKLDAADEERRAMVATIARLTQALPPPVEDLDVPGREGAGGGDHVPWWRRLFGG